MHKTNNSHNKKRNVGLLYEFLVKYISTAVIDKNDQKSSKAIKIIKKHFKPGTELYREFRLINSLVKTTVSSDSVAVSILQEAKTAAKQYDQAKLDHEKSLLIKHINHSLNDENFYDQQINEYKAYATIQTIVNDWRRKDKDISRLAQYEDNLVKWLVSEKNAVNESQTLSEESPGVSRLMLKIMTKKINEKYNNALSNEQKSLVKTYVFSTVNKSPEILQKKLTEIRTNLIKKIDDYSLENPNDQVVNEKMNLVKEQLLNESTAIEDIDDDSVTRFMLYTKLTTEIESE